MTPNQIRNRPSSNLPPAPESCLERPQALKNWSLDLTRIISRNSASVFDDHEFREGRLTKLDLTRTLQKISGCGSVVELRAKVDRSTGEMGGLGLHAANFCGQHAICPYCAARVQDRRKARFKGAIHAASIQYPHAYLVTATLPPSPTWRDNLRRLLDGWKSFRLMGQRRKGRHADRSGGEWAKMRAGLAKVEIKRGQNSGQPHCHIHALFFTSDLLDFRIWSEEEKAKPREERKGIHGDCLSKITREWYRATGGATGLDVKKIKFRAPKRYPGELPDTYRARAENWSLGDSIYEQAREVLKYATKFESAPETKAEALFAKDFAAIKSATYGRRLFATYGDFRHVGGSDYTDGSCPISENPIIYEARWRGNRYAPLVERSRPVFPNSDPGPALSRRLQVLNRIQGATRRIRTAIHEAKRIYCEQGALVPATFQRREWLEGGGFIETPACLEMPGYVLSHPDDSECWERWQDEATAAGRFAYAAARENLDLESHERIVGTREEREAVEASQRLWWRHSDGYEAAVIRSFMEILAPCERAAAVPPS